MIKMMNHRNDTSKSMEIILISLQILMQIFPESGFNGMLGNSWVCQYGMKNEAGKEKPKKRTSLKARDVENVVFVTNSN